MKNSLYPPLQEMNFTYVRLCTTIAEQSDFQTVFTFWRSTFEIGQFTFLVFRTERIDNLVFYHIIIAADIPTIDVLFDQFNKLLAGAGLPEDKERFHRTIDLKKIL